VEVHLCFCASSVSGDSVPCHYGKGVSGLFDFLETYPGVFPSPPSHCYAQETQLPALSHPGLRHKVSACGIAFPPLRRTKTLFWPGACRTVLAVPDLVAVP